jgi:hypothetical protein
VLQEKATVHFPAGTLQFSSTCIWLLSEYPEALTVRLPILRSLTLAAFMELTEIVVLALGWRVPLPGKEPNQG